jgi:NDP-sugar pyrophosphorylase family protein
MKVAILARGKGSRSAEMTDTAPEALLDIGDLVRFHRRHGCVATVTAT